MADIIKVNFNTLKVKIPTLKQPLIGWINNNTLVISHDNLEEFETVRMKIYINGEFKLDTDNDKIEYVIDNISPDETYIVTIDLIGTISKLTKSYSHTIKLTSVIKVCSNNAICSNSQLVHE